MRRIARLEFHDEKQLRHSTLGRRIVIGTVAFSIAFGGSVALAGSAAADGTGTISGIANDAYGSALPGATVSVFGDSDTDLVTTATTKSDGTYTTAEIPDGTYRVKFSAASALDDWYQDASDYADATDVVVADAETPNIDGDLGLKTYSFSGTVTGKAHGEPVEGVEIDAYADDINATDDFQGSAVTDSDGKYEVDGLVGPTKLHVVGVDDYGSEWIGGGYNLNTAATTDFESDITQAINNAEIVTVKSLSAAYKLSTAELPPSALR